MTINTVEIEARLASEYWDDDGGATGCALDGDVVCADIAYLLAALKAETARAEKAEALLQDTRGAFDAIRRELTAANEKLAAAQLDRDKWRKLYDEARLSDMNHNYNPFTDHR